MSISTAICCITKNCPEAYMTEWALYHLSIGFDKLFLYNNNDKPLTLPEDKRIIQIPFNIRDKPQMPAYHQYINTYRNNIDWTAFIDDDEYIVLKEHACIQELLKGYSAYSGLGLPWRMFGSSGQDKRPSGGRICHFTSCAPVHYPPNNHIKTIAKTEFISGMGCPHSCVYSKGWAVNLKQQRIDGPFTQACPEDVAYIHHYFTGSREDWQERRARPRPDSGTMRSWEEFDLTDKACTETCTFLKEYWEKRKTQHA
jgi:hypothetical protein